MNQPITEITIPEEDKKSRVLFTTCFECDDKFLEVLKTSKYLHQESLPYDNTNEQLYKYSYDYSNLDTKTLFTLKNRDKVYGLFNKSYIYIFENYGKDKNIKDDNYFFISSEYEITSENEYLDIRGKKYHEDLINLGNTAYRFSHRSVMNKKYNPGQEKAPYEYILENLTSNLSFKPKLAYFTPQGLTINKFRFSTYEELKKELDETSIKEQSNTNIYSYTFAYYPTESSLKDLESNENDIQALKNIAYGNTPTFALAKENDLKRIGNKRFIIATRAGVSIANHLEIDNYKYINQDKQKEPLYNLWYIEFLKAIKEVIFFEVKTDEFNSMEFPEHFKDKDIDNINTELRLKKNKRRAAKLEFTMKNSKELNDEKKVFYGTYLEAINTKDTIDNFIMVSNNIDEELQSEINNREEKRDKTFDLTFSVIAIISIFKDFSDLVFDSMAYIQTYGFHISSVTDFLSLFHPVICIAFTIAFLLILKHFRNK